LNPYKITNFIVICQALVEIAKTVSRFKVPVSTDFRSQLESFSTLLNLSPEVTSYIQQRIMKFHPERISGISTTQA
jgi:hypothetical protein